MSGSVNKVILVGNLGADPEVKSFQNGGKVCNLRIATSESWKDKATGERKERTEWHSVTLQSDGLVKVAESYLRKGSKVAVSGELSTREHNGKTYLQCRADHVSIQGTPQGEQRQSEGTKGLGGGFHDPNDLDDSIPF